MAIPLSYSSKSLWQRRATTLASAFGIALVVFVLAASQMLSSGMRSTLLRAASESRAIVMQNDAYSEVDSRMPHSALALVAAAPGVKKGTDGSPLVTGESLVQILIASAGDPADISAVHVRGVSDNVFELRPETRIVRGRHPNRGSDEAMVGKAIEGRYEGLELGAKFSLKKGRDISVVGVFEARGSAFESEVWTSIDVVRTSLGWEGNLASVTAVLESKSAFDSFASVLESDKSQGLGVTRERAYYEKVSEGLSRSVQTLGALVSLIFACGAMLGATITMNGAVAQRRREIGVLRALGFSPRHVLAAFLVEAAMLALAGALAGLALASLLAFSQFSITNDGTGNEIVFPFELTGGILGRSLVAGALAGVVGGFLPALRAARTNPAAAMRP